MTDVIERTRLRLSVGDDPGVVSDLPERARRALTVAGAAGASVLEGLDSAADAEADARRARRAVTVACAQSRAVAGGLLAAPLLLLPVLGRVLDADLLGFYTQPIGWAVAGVVLLLLGMGAGGVAVLLRRARSALQPPDLRPTRWPAALVAFAVGYLVAWWLAPLAGLLVARRRPAVRPVADADEVADLLATALTGGTAPAQAVREVASVRPDLATPLGRLAFDLDLGTAHAGHPPPLERIASLLHAAAQAGAPAGDALRRLGADLRAEDLARALAAAERLPAQLTFPTALALLPAVLLAIGAPIVHAGLSAAVGI